MGRDVPYDPDLVCEGCNRVGAYDFMGDYLCDRCASGRPLEEQENLASAITKISDNLDTLLKSGLNKRAIIVLLQDATRIRRGDIKAVLDALPRLKEMYCSDLR